MGAGEVAVEHDQVLVSKPPKPFKAIERMRMVQNMSDDEVNKLCTPGPNFRPPQPWQWEALEPTYHSRSLCGDCTPDELCCWLILFNVLRSHSHH